MPNEAMFLGACVVVFFAYLGLAEAWRILSR